MYKKKVLIVAAVFPPEPIVSANLLFELATELSKDYSVTVLRPYPSRPCGFTMPDWDLSNHQFRVITLNSYTFPESKLIGRFRESYSMGKVVVQYIEKHNQDIDFIFNNAWHLFGRYMVAKAAVKYGIPYITPVQDIYPESLISKLPPNRILHWLVKSTLLPLDKYNLLHADKIHTISDKMVHILTDSRKLPPEKFVVVRNWQDDKQFTDFLAKDRSINKKEDFLTLMYLGNVGYLAGLETVIDALKLIPDTNIKFIIAGSGSAKKDLIEKAKFDERISFIDVPNGAVPTTQAKADIMILPVRRGFALSSIPSKLPAYMFSSKPVLASVDKESDTAQCILNSEGGWVVNPEDPKSLAEQIKICSNIDIIKLKEMGQRGRIFAMKYLSRDQNLSKLVDACKKVIDNK